jgi:formylglycine-generating enzyme required for sulfatase activity
VTPKHMLRGGSWLHLAQGVHCVSRSAFEHHLGYYYFGFRPVAKALPPDSLRVLRGGSWILYAQYVRCAYRRASEPGFRLLFSGLRPVAKAKP